MKAEDYGPLCSWEEYKATGCAHRVTGIQGVFSLLGNLPSQVRDLEEKAEKILAEQS